MQNFSKEIATTTWNKVCKGQGLISVIVRKTNTDYHCCQNWRVPDWHIDFFVWLLEASDSQVAQYLPSNQSPSFQYLGAFEKWNDCNPNWAEKQLDCRLLHIDCSAGCLNPEIDERTVLGLWKGSKTLNWQETG